MLLSLFKIKVGTHSTFFIELDYSTVIFFSFCKISRVAAMRRLHKERQSPHCTILMGQRLRERECEFVPTFKYGTVKSKKPLVSIGQCCSWVVDNYPSEQIKGCPVKAEDIYRYLRMIS